MQVKKRGMISVVLVLLIIGLAGGVHIEVDTPYPEGPIIAGHPLSTNSHWYWYFNCRGCDGDHYQESLLCSNNGYRDPRGTEDSCPFVESKDALRIEEHTEPYGVGDLHECQFDRVPEPHKIRQDKLGCLAIANEENEGASDGCAYKYIHEGYIFTSGGSAKLLPNEPPAYTSILETPFEIANVWGSSTEWTDYNGAALVLNIFRLDGGWSPGGAVPQTTGRPWQSNYPGDFICAYDYKWHGCDENSVGRAIWAEQRILYNNFFPQTHLFICEEQDYLYHWIDKGVDNDQDGYVSTEDGGNDCDDSVTSDPIFCSDIEEPSDCDSNVKYRQCAICINPSSPEICGDGINNDCRGNGREFGAAVNELEGATPDSCDRFKQGCEAPSEGYLMDGEEYINEEGETISVDEKLSRAYGNAQGQQFSWTDTPDGGSCCWNK